MKLTAKKKLEEQARGIRYGCHVDLFTQEEEYEPDGCVKDENPVGYCVYESRHRTREGCPYWLAVTPESIKKARGGA